MTFGHHTTPARVALLAGPALLAGLLIALADSSPGWDSTGVTAGALVLAAGGAAYLGRARPWLWAALVGLPTPIIEIAGSGATGSLLALVFAGIGATTGWAARRAG
ncbi:MAG TPA: hypothetical protein VIU37_01650 [Candidatus Limnocylindrales bacterium]